MVTWQVSPAASAAPGPVLVSPGVSAASGPMLVSPAVSAVPGPWQMSWCCNRTLETAKQHDTQATDTKNKDKKHTN